MENKTLIKIRKLYDKFSNNSLNISDKRIQKIVEEYIPVFIETTKNNKFLVENLYLLEILLKTKNIKNNKYKTELENLTTYLNELYKKDSIHINKVMYAVIEFFALLYENRFHTAKKNLIEKLVFLDFNKLYPNKEIRNLLNHLIKLIFPDINDIFSIYRKHILTEDFYNKSINEQKLSLLWISQIFWNIYTASKEFINLYDDIYQLFINFVKIKNDELVLISYHIASRLFLNILHNPEEIEKFHKDFEKPLTKYIENVLMNKHNIKPNKRRFTIDKKPLKIAFVYPRLIENSPGYLLYNLLETLQSFNKNHFELYLYDLEIIEVSLSDLEFINKIKKLGIKYIPCHNLLPDEEKEKGFLYSQIKKLISIRNKIIQDNIDILIMLNNNAYYNFLFTTRTAPKQIYWSHGNLIYDVKNIDKRIVHFEHKNKKFQWNVFKIPTSEIYLKGTEKDKEEGEKLKNELLNKYGKDTVFLGSIGRLMKMNNEKYLSTIAQIMKENPNTIYVAVGSGAPIEEIKGKLKNYGINENRFIFTGHANPHIYGWVIDVYLDTFPVIGGQSVEEFLAKKRGPVVRLVEKPDSYFSMVGKKVLERIGGFEGILNLNKEKLKIIEEEAKKEIINILYEEGFIDRKDYKSLNEIEPSKKSNLHEPINLIYKNVKLFNENFPNYTFSNEIVPLNKAAKKYRNIHYLKITLKNFAKTVKNKKRKKLILDTINKEKIDKKDLEMLKNEFETIRPDFLDLILFFENVDIRYLYLFQIYKYLNLPPCIFENYIKYILFSLSTSTLSIDEYVEVSSFFIKNTDLKKLYEPILNIRKNNFLNTGKKFFNIIIS